MPTVHSLRLPQSIIGACSGVVMLSLAKSSPALMGSTPRVSSRALNLVDYQLVISKSNVSTSSTTSAFIILTTYTFTNCKRLLCFGITKVVKLTETTSLITFFVSFYLGLYKPYDNVHGYSIVLRVIR